MKTPKNIKLEEPTMKHAINNYYWEIKKCQTREKKIEVQIFKEETLSPFLSSSRRHLVTYSMKTSFEYLWHRAENDVSSVCRSNAFSLILISGLEHLIF